MIKCIENVLIALYQPFWCALVISVLFMLVWKDYNSVSQVLRAFFTAFKDSIHFRAMFGLVFYSSMILFRTVLNRKIWLNPISNILGQWTLHDNEGKLTTEVLENLALFIPFAVLLLINFHEKIIGMKITLGKVLWQSTKIVFLFSFTIEMLQLLLRLGTWQLSDLFYNTLGGFIGGLIYWIGYTVKHRGSVL